MTVQKERMKWLVWLALKSIQPIQVKQTLDSVSLGHHKNKAWENKMTPLFFLCATPPSSAPHVSSVCPAGVQSWLRLAECVCWRLDAAAHTDGMQATGIHKVSSHPPWMKGLCCKFNARVIWNQALHRPPSVFCLTSEPRSTSVPVDVLISSLKTGPFTAVGPGTTTTPIHQATIDRCVRQQMGKLIALNVAVHGVICHCCTDLKSSKTRAV